MHIATKGSKIDISSEKRLEEFAGNFSTKLRPRNIVFIFGEMGVGKTTFVKYLVNSLQIRFNKKKTEVISPTFNIMNEYNIDDMLIKHYDLFRLKSDEELQNLNLFDQNDKSILLIEWPQIIKKKPDFVTKLYFEYGNDYKKRFINIDDS